jgi:uncharacterized protein with GYD domain
MAGYVILGKFRQGPPDMSNVEQDISALKTGAEKLGARIVGLWALMGRFDVVIVVDAPDEMRAVGVAGLASRTLNVSTETARAFGEDELSAVARQLPR